MKIFVINLEARPDRLAFMSNQLQDLEWERFSAINGHELTLDKISKLGFEPYYKWRDPILNRALTTTEISAAISHYMLWEKCAELNEPILILEDDSELVGELNFDEIEALSNNYDIVYLDHREMFSDYAIVGDVFTKPHYPYWNNAYIITPRLAQQIIQSKYRHNLIPVDELFPLLSGVNYNQTSLGNTDMFLNLASILKLDNYGLTRPIAYRNSIFKQMPRKILGSDIENGKQIMSNVYVVTVATDESKMHYLQTSAAAHGIELINNGKGIAWEGGDMKGPGGGHKLTLMRQYLTNLNSDDIVLFVDGYDVIINDDLNTIVERFKGFNCRVLFAAEKTCWPDKSIAHLFDSHTDYKYLNSGTYIGYVTDILALTSDCIGNSEDDQLFLQKKYIEYSRDNKNIIKLDNENYIFQCLANATNDVIIKPNKQLVNTNTRCCPCILHGNGGESTKREFNNIFNALFSVYNADISFSDPSELQVVAPEILEIDLLTPEMCEKLIDKAEKNGDWKSMYGDKFPAQEMRIRELDLNLFNQMEEHLKQKVYPLIENYWKPLLMYGLRDAFIIKYSPQTQASLKCHHDASLVSGNVKLNSDYTGGDTYYYRQNFSNINTPIGKMTLWPGQVTHGHEGREVTSGTKYNLVIWTSRRPGDLNY